MQRYRVSLEMRALAPRTINLRLAAVRKLAEEAAAQAWLPEAKVSEIRSVKGAKVLGSRAGNWLTRAQAEKLLSLPDIETLKGKRDRALLALFVSAGPRREELATLLREQMHSNAMGDGVWWTWWGKADACGLWPFRTGRNKPQKFGWKPCRSKKAQSWAK
jgi:site-specific recombinase XerD